MSKKPYAEQIRIPTQKAADNTIETKHSEFKKPYLSDTYEEMEYLADAPPGFAFAPSGMDTLWMGTPVPNFGSMYTPWHLTFFCLLDSDNCYCEGSERCFSLNCTQEIIGIDIKDTGWGVSVSKSRVCITAPEGETGSVTIDINMRAKRPWSSPHGTSQFIYGSHSEISLPACAESECCVVDTGIAWDDTNSDDTIAQSGTAAIAITGNNKPFNWQVSGTGFTLANSKTTVVTNTLNASASACGKASITVTGCDGSVASGYVLCTTGQWTLDSYITDCATATSATVEKITGDTKLIDLLWFKSGCPIDCSAYASGCATQCSCPAAGQCYTAASGWTGGDFVGICVFRSRRNIYKWTC